MIVFNENIYEQYLNDFYKEMPEDMFLEEFKKFKEHKFLIIKKKGGTILKQFNNKLFTSMYNKFSSFLEYENSYEFQIISDMNNKEKYDWTHIPTLKR